MGQCSSRRQTTRSTRNQLSPENLSKLLHEDDVNGNLASFLPIGTLAGFRVASPSLKVAVDAAMENKYGQGYTITKRANIAQKLGPAVPVQPRPNAIATDAELVDGHIKVRGVAVLLWDENGPEAAAVEALLKEKTNNVRPGSRQPVMKGLRRPPEFLEAYPAPPALDFARTITDIVLGADDGTMRLHEVAAAYEATQTIGAFDAHLKLVHKDPTWFPKTGVPQNTVSPYWRLVGLARFFNSSVGEIDVFVLQSHGRETKFDDFRGTLRSLSGGKENKTGQTKLKHAIGLRKA